MGSRQTKLDFVDFEFPKTSPTEKVTKSIYIKQPVEKNSKLKQIVSLGIISNSS